MRMCIAGGKLCCKEELSLFLSISDYRNHHWSLCDGLQRHRHRLRYILHCTMSNVLRTILHFIAWGLDTYVDVNLLLSIIYVADIYTQRLLYIYLHKIMLYFQPQGRWDLELL